MKFDTIIIGGGLAGLTAGISLARVGQRTAIIATGQSALHFWSGSFAFIAKRGGRPIFDTPADAIADYPETHPYRLIGRDTTLRQLANAPAMLAEAGIKVRGSLERNHLRATPMGYLKPSWLTMSEYLAVNKPDELRGKRIAIVNIAGYIDCYPRFLDFNFRKVGAECTISAVDIPQLGILRKSTTEMRATNMSRFLRDDAIDALAAEVDKASGGADMVVMPAVVGIFSDEPVERLQRGVGRPVRFVPTLPASVPGVRLQLSLRDLFISLGGTYLPGDTVVKGEFYHHSLKSVKTVNFEDMPLYADNFILASGSFFSHGLIATIDRIYEAALGLDVNAPGNRSEWYDENFFNPQPYMKYGVETDSGFRPLKNGEPLSNVYACGAILGGFNALKEGNGAGITMATAYNAAESILGSEVNFNVKPSKDADR